MDAHHGISKDDRAHQKGGKKEQLSNRNLKKKKTARDENFLGKFVLQRVQGALVLVKHFNI